ncbi:unnamed protein product [Paramecium octaurelia]|uniref:Uncharacterized protein n=1 Tax=Paramecium octaurelia TaxID=43137 RepID=A0A8S1TF79_PAROT|nr:unnamed protein product [Paramecium octaurelia]
MQNSLLKSQLQKEYLIEKMIKETFNPTGYQSWIQENCIRIAESQNYFVICFYQLREIFRSQ